MSFLTGTVHLFCFYFAALIKTIIGLAVGSQPDLTSQTTSTGLVTNNPLAVASGFSRPRLDYFSAEKYVSGLQVRPRNKADCLAEAAQQKNAQGVFFVSRLSDLNRGPSLYKSVALPTELRRQIFFIHTDYHFLAYLPRQLRRQIFFIHTYYHSLAYLPKQRKAPNK